SAAVDQAETVTAGLVSRSLNLRSVVYLNGDSGNDANDGLTSGSSIKTLSRLAQLYSDKVVDLFVFVYGTVQVTEDVTIRCNELTFSMQANSKVWFRADNVNLKNWKLI